MRELQRAFALQAPIVGVNARDLSTFKIDRRTQLDLRLSRTFRTGGNRRVQATVDVYNIFNTNAEQALTTSSGSAFLRPVAITPPRVARIGLKLQW